VGPRRGPGRGPGSGGERRGADLGSSRTAQTTLPGRIAAPHSLHPLVHILGKGRIEESEGCSVDKAMLEAKKGSAPATLGGRGGARDLQGFRCRPSFELILLRPSGLKRALPVPTLPWVPTPGKQYTIYTKRECVHVRRAPRALVLSRVLTCRAPARGRVDRVYGNIPLGWLGPGLCGTRGAGCGRCGEGRTERGAAGEKGGVITNPNGLRQETRALRDSSGSVRHTYLCIIIDAMRECAHTRAMSPRAPANARRSPGPPRTMNRE
jgi:hypothetical protein